MQIALIADRLRVEERLLISAFETKGHEARLFTPATMHIVLREPVDVVASIGSKSDHVTTSIPGLALDRGVTTFERAALAALIASQGTLVINRPATGRLLSDRLALLRHLVGAEIPVPETIVSFGEEATFRAIEQLGYPVVLKSLTVDPSFPVALIEDQDSAEAIVEHRTTLGGERAVLVQRYIAGPAHSLRLVITGRQLVGVETRPHTGWRPARSTDYGRYEGDTSALASLAQHVIERLGSGVYTVEVLEAETGPTVVGAANLVDFRTLHDQGIDVAGQIVDFALAQMLEKSEGEQRG